MAGRRSMKGFIIAGIVMIPIIFAGCSRVSYNPGTMVAGKWKDGLWYIAKINSCTGSGCTTEFHDGTAVELKFDEIKAIPQKIELKNGDKVWAVWPTTNAFHDGTVSELTDKGGTVSWDQGGTPSFVEFGMMMKK